MHFQDTPLKPSMLRWIRSIVILGCLSFSLRSPAAQPSAQLVPPRFESVTLNNGGPPATLHLLSCPGATARHPVILMPGALDSNAPPAWSTNLLQEGWMLCAFSVAHPPDP